MAHINHIASGADLFLRAYPLLDCAAKNVEEFLTVCVEVEIVAGSGLEGSSDKDEVLGWRSNI